jgi:hypothetical protein
MQSHGDDVRMRVLNALHWDFAVPKDADPLPTGRH